MLFTVISEGQDILGAILSSIVTKALQVAVCPLVSVTVNVTEFVPKLLQLKAVCDAEREAIPKSSVLPPSISEAIIITFPVASS